MKVKESHASLIHIYIYIYICVCCRPRHSTICLLTLSRALLGSTGLFWVLLDSPGLFSALLGFLQLSGRLWMTPGFPWRLLGSWLFFSALLGSLGLSSALLASFGVSWALLAVYSKYNIKHQLGSTDIYKNLNISAVCEENAPNGLMSSFGAELIRRKSELIRRN